MALALWLPRRGPSWFVRVLLGLSFGAARYWQARNQSFLLGVVVRVLLVLARYWQLHQLAPRHRKYPYKQRPPGMTSAWDWPCGDHSRTASSHRVEQSHNMQYHRQSPVRLLPVLREDWHLLNLLALRPVMRVRVLRVATGKMTHLTSAALILRV